MWLHDFFQNFYQLVQLSSSSWLGVSWKFPRLVPRQAILSASLFDPVRRHRSFIFPRCHLSKLHYSTRMIEQKWSAALGGFKRFSNLSLSLPWLARDSKGIYIRYMNYMMWIPTIRNTYMKCINIHISYCRSDRYVNMNSIYLEQNLFAHGYPILPQKHFHRIHDSYFRAMTHKSRFHHFFPVGKF